MNHYALKYALDGAEYRVLRVSTETTDRAAVLQALLASLFFMPSAKPEMTGYGALKDGVIYGFTESTAKSFADEVLGMLSVKHTEIKFKSLTLRDQNYDGLSYEDAFGLLTESIPRVDEAAQTQGYTLPLLKKGVVYFNSFAAVTLPALSLPEPSLRPPEVGGDQSWWVLSYDNKNPQTFVGKTYESLSTHITADADIQNPYLVADRVMRAGERLQIFLGERTDTRRWTDYELFITQPGVLPHNLNDFSEGVIASFKGGLGGIHTVIMPLLHGIVHNYDKNFIELYYSKEDHHLYVAAEDGKAYRSATPFSGQIRLISRPQTTYDGQTHATRPIIVEALTKSLYTEQTRRELKGHTL